MRWESFHGDWITMIVQRLNTHTLSEKYLATGRSRIESQIEVDIGTAEQFEYNGSRQRKGMTSDGGVAIATQTYAPPEPALAGEVEFAEEELFEVQIATEENRLVAAIELVSLANKDRPAKRRAFAAKVASYLSRGVSVVVVDPVTIRQAQTHSEIVDVVQLPESFAWKSPTHLSAIAYRMIQIAKKDRLEIWPHELKVGEPLPTLPLWLAADLAVPLELETTYAATCAGLRIE